VAAETARIEAPTSFRRGQPVEIRASAAEAGWQHVLHYRHVNQAERWRSMPMPTEGGAARAQIPADYTDSIFHLQVYVTSVSGERLGITPGFPSLGDVPYLLIPQEG
jgi:hypothetical protein